MAKSRAQLRRDLYFLVLPGIESYIDIAQGEPMADGPVRPARS